jgi:hypothetical protein
MARRPRAAKAGRTASGRFKKTKGKNMAANRLGKKGHRKSCRKVR